MLQSAFAGFFGGVTAEMDITQKSISAAKVILTGFVVVFSMLLLLILIIKLYSKIISTAQKSGKKKLEKIDEPVKISDGSKSAVFAPSADDDDDEIPEEVVAVIAAAVASLYGTGAKPKIRSIKKSGGGRSAWANAGVLNNTRPF